MSASSMDAAATIGGQAVRPGPPLGVEASAAALADAQLAAYVAGDLSAFCACYADDVRVLDADGQVQLDGIEAFGARYAALFSSGGYGATVHGRMFLPEHCVDLEQWWRIDPETGARIEGTVLVRYTVRDGRIRVVEFLR